MSLIKKTLDFCLKICYYYVYYVGRHRSRQKEGGADHG